MTSRLRMMIPLVGVIWLGGCGARAVDGPPTIRFGQTACTECRMLINEGRFAAALLTAHDEVETFDSVECLIRRLGRHPSGDVKHVWVHDYEHPQWLDARGAFFVRSPALQTPMGGGLVALGSEPAAVKLAAETHGQVVRFDELQVIVD